MNKVNTFLANAGVSVTIAPSKVKEVVKVNDVAQPNRVDMDTNFQSDNGCCNNAICW